MTAFLFADRPDDIARVRQVLDRADYTVEAVRRVMGDEGFTFLSRGEVAPVLRRTRGGSALETLIRLFLCGVEVELADAARALAPMTPGEWVSAGLVASGPGGVTGLIKMRPYEVTGQRWIVAYDSSGGRRQHAADYVIGVGAASMTLAGMTVAPSGWALPRPGHRWRDPGVARQPARRRRGGHRPQPARRVVRILHHGAERNRQRHGPPRRPVRARHR